jgi:hypothetical protein
VDSWRTSREGHLASAQVYRQFGLDHRIIYTQLRITIFKADSIARDAMNYNMNIFMSDRTFTLDEAQLLLPVLESLLRTSIDGKKLIESVDEEFQELAHRIFLSGGLHVNIVHMARRKAEREKAIQRVKDAMAEIDAIGVQVKDLDIGLLDFPCDVEGQTILLCWKLGETGITHWHGTHEGFAGRKPIDERISKSRRTH